MSMSSMSCALFVALCMLAFSNAFMVRNTVRSNQQHGKALFALGPEAVEKLEEMSARYSRLSNVVSDDAEAQKKQMQDTVEKYTTYKDIKKLMGKLQNIWKNEASETRRAKQLKNYVDLFTGRLEIEEVLKEKLGMPFSKDVPKIKEVDEVLKWDEELASLSKKLTEVEMKMPTGMSTRDERFRLGM